MYVCMYVCASVYVCVDVCVYVHVYACMYVCVCMYVRVYACMYVCVCMYLCVCVYVCVCMYVYVCRERDVAQSIACPHLKRSVVGSILLSGPSCSLGYFTFQPVVHNWFTKAVVCTVLSMEKCI